VECADQVKHERSSCEGPATKRRSSCEGPATLRMSKIRIADKFECVDGTDMDFFQKTARFGEDKVYLEDYKTPNPF